MEKDNIPISVKTTPDDGFALVIVGSVPTSSHGQCIVRHNRTINITPQQAFLSIRDDPLADVRSQRIVNRQDTLVHEDIIYTDKYDNSATLGDYKRYYVPQYIVPCTLSPLLRHFHDSFIMEQNYYSIKEKIPHNKDRDKHIHLIELLNHGIDRIYFTLRNKYYLISRNAACLSTCSGVIGCRITDPNGTVREIDFVTHTPFNISHFIDQFYLNERVVRIVTAEW